MLLVLSMSIWLNSSFLKFSVQSCFYFLQLYVVQSEQRSVRYGFYIGTREAIQHNVNEAIFGHRHSDRNEACPNMELLKIAQL